MNTAPLRCWPGCVARIIGGLNAGRFVTVERESDIFGRGWWWVKAHGGHVVGFYHGTNAMSTESGGHIEDSRLRPITPPPGTVTDSEVTSLYEPSPTKETV